MEEKSFCPNCLQVVKIIRDYTHFDQEEYLLRFSGNDCCTNCNYQVTFYGLSDIHEGQPNNNIDDFLMSLDYDSFPMGKFKDIDKPYLSGQNFKWFLVDAVSADIDEEKMALIESKLITAPLTILNGVDDYNTEKLIRCNVCNKFQNANISRGHKSPVSLRCTKCGTVEDLELEANKDHLKVNHDLRLFSVLGNLDLDKTDAKHSSRSAHNLHCVRCNEVKPLKIAYRNTTSREKHEFGEILQCANCNYFEETKS
jgi:hypothetical protein